MSNYIEFKDKIAFHPGYYIKEIVVESGLTQEDFAKRLDTTPKNLSLIIRGEQSLSIDIAMKLSRMLGTSISYWLNLQNSYDSLVAEFKSENELVEERVVFQNVDYSYFRDNYGLPDLPRQKDEQIKRVREFLNLATLKALTKKDMSVSFRSADEVFSSDETIKANIMVQIATNEALKVEAPKFDKHKFEKAISYALKIAENNNEFYSLTYKAFLETGVVLLTLPNLPGANIEGATKKISHNIMLMINDRKLKGESIRKQVFCQSAHILNGDYGITFTNESSVKETADYNALIKKYNN
jgi:addiction module HigA family antidote